MSQEKSSSHRDAPVDQSDGEEDGSARHTVDERTAKVLDDVDDFLDEVDEVLYGNIKDEDERTAYAKMMKDEFVQKGGQ